MSDLHFVKPQALVNLQQKYGKLVFSHQTIGEKTALKLRIQGLKLKEQSVLMDVILSWAQDAQGNILGYDARQGLPEGSFQWLEARVYCEVSHDALLPQQLEYLKGYNARDVKRAEEALAKKETPKKVVKWAFVRPGLGDGELLSMKIDFEPNWIQDTQKGVALGNPYIKITSIANLTALDFQGLERRADTAATVDATASVVMADELAKNIAAPVASIPATAPVFTPPVAVAGTKPVNNF